MAVSGPEGRQPWLLGLICIELRGICIFEKLLLWEGREGALGGVSQVFSLLPPSECGGRGGAVPVPTSHPTWYEEHS